MRLALITATLGAACAATNAQLVLQMDVNAMTVQALDSLGAPTTFGGASHTGAVALGFDPANTSLVDIFLRSGAGGFASQGFNGVLTDFLGSVVLSNGFVQGGNIRVTVNGNTADPDIYVASIVPGVGSVKNFIGGGYTIEGLTFNGAFDDPVFGNVGVGPFMGGNLTGSFLQFNFFPNAAGQAYADVDIFVVPAPASGLACLVASAVLARRRRR